MTDYCYSLACLGVRRDTDIQVSEDFSLCLPRRTLTSCPKPHPTFCQLLGVLAAGRSHWFRTQEVPSDEEAAWPKASPLAGAGVGSEEQREWLWGPDPFQHRSSWGLAYNCIPASLCPVLLCLRCHRVWTESNTQPPSQSLFPRPCALQGRLKTPAWVQAWKCVWVQPGPHWLTKWTPCLLLPPPSFPTHTHVCTDELYPFYKGKVVRTRAQDFTIPEP